MNDSFLAGTRTLKVHGGDEIEAYAATPVVAEPCGGVVVHPSYTHGSPPS